MACFSVWPFPLLAVIRAFTGGDWLPGLAYPIAALCVGLAWLYFAVLCWLRVGPWLKTGLCALLTAFALPAINTVVSALLPGQKSVTWGDYFAWGRILTREDVNGESWVNVLVFAILLLLALGLTAAGAAAELRRRRH